MIANYFIGCEAGRREANVYSYVSTVLAKKYPNVLFLSSLKGGSASSCVAWADSYEQNGAVNLLGVDTAGLTVDDNSYAMRDVFFTSPFPHPSYIIIDYEGKVRGCDS